MEAADYRLPVFDRLKFLSIYSSNLEEFYRVRVSEHLNLLDKPDVPAEELSNAAETMQEINREVKRQLKEFDTVFQKRIIPLLAAHHIVLYQHQPDLSLHRDFVRTYFEEEIFPFLQPMLLLKDQIRSFLRGSRLYLAVRLYKKGEENASGPLYAVLKIPYAKVPRFIELPPYEGNYYLMFVEDVIGANLDVVFPGFRVEAYYSIRVSRDADFAVNNVNKGSLVDEIRRQVKKRKIGAYNRLVYDGNMPDEMLRFLCETYRIPYNQCLASGKYLTLEDLIRLPNPTGIRLSYEIPEPLRVAEFDEAPAMYPLVVREDKLLHFPYQSFDYIVRFLTEAAYDPEVTEIKITQYRVAENSAVINTLITAAGHGKKVTVFVELKARFDEENNIESSERMWQAGIRVVYSLPGQKVHAKMALVVRRASSADGPKFMAYLSTGNFNEKTARIYSDMGLLTCNPLLTLEVDRLFSLLENPGSEAVFRRLLVTGFNMLPFLKDKLLREMEEARQGKKAYVILKMNGLQDQDMINLLYDASEAGVQIDLIVRGICCLVPQQPYSRNIRIIRIVDAFLEHSRIWYFYAAGAEDVYLSSADWMKRNLTRRIETAFPVLHPRLKDEIITILRYQLSDNVKACRLDEHLRNIYVRNDLPDPVRSQWYTYKLLRKQSWPASVR